MARDLQSFLGSIHHGDCVEGLRSVPHETVDLVFADPPFNIGFEYDQYDDQLDDDQYLGWSAKWMNEVWNVLKPDGTFWLAIGDEYAAELKVEAQKIGFHCRSWVIWYYTFGVNCKKKFTRSHAHLFHFVKDQKSFTFNHDDLDLRVPSARRLVYNDKRANPDGRMPDDTWILRPQELVNGFDPVQDTWHFPRVAGTFKERAGFHGCQMPEQLLGRIIRACSNPGEVVVDPFSGSSTTLAVAKKLGRRFFGFELSDDYVGKGSQRLNSIEPGDSLVGAEEPSMANFNARDEKGKANTVRKEKRSGGAESQLLLFPAEAMIHDELASDVEGILKAFTSASLGFSVERVIVDPILNEDFQRFCDRNSISGSPAERNRFLLRIRKEGMLAKNQIDGSRETEVAWKDVRSFVFASEIAWRQIGNRYGLGLDELFCDPRIASEFDQIAAEFAPGRQPFEYRWAALQLRREGSLARKRARKGSDDEFGISSLRVEQLVKGQGIRISEINFDPIPPKPGAYVIRDADGEALYASESENLLARISAKFMDADIRSLWLRRSTELELFFTTVDAIEPNRQLARQCLLLKWHQPAWNSVTELSA